MSNRSGTGGRLQRFLGRTGPPQQGQDHGIVRPSPEGDPDGASELNGIGSDWDAAKPLCRRGPQAMSPVGTTRTCRRGRSMSVVGGGAEKICSQWVFRLLTKRRHQEAESCTVCGCWFLGSG